MDLELVSKIAESGLGWAVAAYMFILLIREKDKRINDAGLKKEDRQLLRSIRKFLEALSRKAEVNVEDA